MLPQCRRCRRYLRREKFNNPDNLCDACHHKSIAATDAKYALDGNVEEHEITVTDADLDIPVLIRQNETAIRDLLDESIQRHGYVYFI